MLGVEDEPIDVPAAMARIEDARRRVAEGRHWRATSFALVAVVTLAYFAVMGGVDDASSGLPGVVVTMAPTMVVLAVAAVWNRHRSPDSRRTVQREYRLAVVFGMLVCVAGVLATVLPHPLPASLAGIAPAAPCVVGAWWAGRT